MLFSPGNALAHISLKSLRDIHPPGLVLLAASCLGNCDCCSNYLRTINGPELLADIVSLQESTSGDR